MITTNAWGEYTTLIVKARDSATKDLIMGTRDRFGNSDDESKRAMIYAMNVILDLPISVERDAQNAAEAIRRYNEQLTR